MKKILVGAISVFALTTTLYADENSNNFQNQQSRVQNKIGIGFGIGSSSKLYKQEDANAVPFPLLDIKYDNFYVQGMNIGYQAYRNDLLTMSIFLDPLAGFPIEGEDMKKGYTSIDDRESQAMVGLKADFDFSKIDMRGTALFQAGEHGSKARASLFKVVSIDKFKIIPSAFVSYFTSDFSDYYFGISEKEVSRGSRIENTYEADGAFSTGIKITGDYSVNDRLSLVIFLGAERFSDEIKDSPIVENSTIYSAGVGAKYFF
ncbi:MAG: MipA/OmpV family protein [Fusobacteriaceae bacterium]